MSTSTSRTIRANIFFAEKDRALREDVHRLGELAHREGDQVSNLYDYLDQPSAGIDGTTTGID